MQSLWIGASGLHASQLWLDITAHNLANVNTTAFRAGRPAFREERVAQLDRPVFPLAEGLPGGAGVTVAAVLTDPSPGALEATENPHHLAITGAGFFRLRGAQGEELYTREGIFAPDAEGRLTTSDGALLLDEDDDPIKLPEWAEGFRVQPDGTVVATAADREQEVAVLGLAHFVNIGGLAALGQNRFAATAASGPAVIDRPGSEGLGIVRQGALERSNVDLASEMVSLLLAQRSFQLNARVVQTSDEMMALANRLPG
ncbi:MAG TPA: flagellar hook-basal body protein [Bacillota bacterium]